MPFEPPSKRVGTRPNEARCHKRKKHFATPQKAPGFPFYGDGAKERGAEGIMERGTVKWFSEEKGYGFIEPDEGGEELFVHYTGIEGSGFRSLKEGEKVSYELAQGRRGEQAHNVQRVE